MSNNKKVKLLVFIPQINTDGINKVLADYITGFSNDIVVEIMTLSIKDDMYFKNKKSLIIEIGNGKNVIKRFTNEYKRIKAGNYDVVHINGNYCSRLLECLAAKKAGVKKIIIHSHNSGSGNNNFIRKAIHNILKKMFDIVATDYYACSEAAAKWMFSKHIIERKKWQLIKNGIVIDKYRFNSKIRKKIRNKYNIDNKFVVGHIGRFEKQKNHNFLIEIFKQYKEKNKDSVLLLIGCGPLEEEIKNKIKREGLLNSVLFLGVINNANEFYNAMDCFLFPSLFEGLGLVLVEAQTNGVKCLTSSNVPCEAKLSDNIDYISLSEQPLVWANQICKTNSKYRQGAYRDTIKSGYDIKAVINNLENNIKKR